jgi:DNA helicase-2/ATP-dependent DNA helicase PcrA
MSVNIAEDGNERDSGVVEEICGYLTNQPPQNFFLFAGAGSGKTRTLVEVLRRLTGVTAHQAGSLLAKDLRAFGRSIRVITYTKNAVAVINERLGSNDLVSVSTIHAFCWDLIGGFNDDIRAALMAIQSARIERDKLEASKKVKGISDRDREKFAEAQQKIDEVRDTETFRYSPDKEEYGPGAIQHRDVLEVTAWLLAERPLLRAFLTDRHPLVLIDESQDTMKGMLDALISLATTAGGSLTLGLLGDHRQRIYSDGHADLPGLVPFGWARPELKMNHRSQRRIVSLINTIWEAELSGRTQSPTGVKQYERKEKTGGFVRLFVGDASLDPSEKVDREKQCASLMAGVTSDPAWDAGGYQTLALEHRLVATRGKFLRVYEAMDLIDSNAAAPQGSGENKGPGAVSLLLDELAQLSRSVDSDGRVDESVATALLLGSGCLDLLPSDPIKREERVAEMVSAFAAFGAACSRPGATVGDALKPVVDAKLFDIDGRMLAAFNDKSPPPSVPAFLSKEPKEDRRRRGWCALFDAPWEEIERYRRYLSGESELATHQVVKGSEFANVMVVMDDHEAGGFMFSYDKLFGAKELSDNDQKNAKEGKETTIDRSLRLLYVTCSRAREGLALILWSEQPNAALANIRKSQWFEEGEVLPMPGG